MESSTSALINGTQRSFGFNLKINWILLLEYLKVLIRPIIIIYIAKKFNNEIKNLLNRINKGKLPGGIEFDAPVSQDKAKKDIPEILEKENKLSDKKSNSEIEKLKNDNFNLQTALFLERTYIAIYGSQIKLLEKLRIIGIQGIRYENIAADYEKIKQFWSYLRSYSLTNYLKFLEDSKLIEPNNLNNNLFYKITPTGIDFLQYIEALNYPKDKAY